MRFCGGDAKGEWQLDSPTSVTRVTGSPEDDVEVSETRLYYQVNSVWGSSYGDAESDLVGGWKHRTWKWFRSMGKHAATQLGLLALITVEL